MQWLLQCFCNSRCDLGPNKSQAMSGSAVLWDSVHETGSRCCGAGAWNVICWYFTASEVIPQVKGLHWPQWSQGVEFLEPAWHKSTYTCASSSRMRPCTKAASACACSCRRMCTCLQMAVPAGAACSTGARSPVRLSNPEALLAAGTVFVVRDTIH